MSEYDSTDTTIRDDLDPSRYDRKRLVFDDGALVLKAADADEPNLPSCFVWHAGHWVAPAYQYSNLRKWLYEHPGEVANNVPRYLFKNEFKFERLDGLRGAKTVGQHAVAGQNSSSPVGQPSEAGRTAPVEPETEFSYGNRNQPTRKVAESQNGYEVNRATHPNGWTEGSQPFTTKTEFVEPPFVAGQNSSVEQPSVAGQAPQVRDYQQEAIDSWLALDGRGTIVLPTGAGKSLVATLAIDAVKAPTLVVVPQLDLLHQWYENLSRIYGQANVGAYFGERKDIRPITVTTYVSASSHLDELGNRFYLLICDEVHHLTGATWQHAAKLSIAPKRLALTATYPHDFENHLLLQELIGPPCYYKTPADLAGTYLAEYETVRVRVTLDEDEAQDYAKLKNYYSPFAQKMWKEFGKGWYNRLLYGQNYKIEYRRALLCKNRMEEILEMARAKRLAIARIMALHRGQSAIIFTESNRAVYELAELFLLPAITHHTPAAERKAILDGFRNGEYPAIVTARVLNEGVDLPGAKVAIIVGGTSGATEYIQRLGRILRRQGGSKAFLYELVVRDSLEEGVSNRRRQKPDQTIAMNTEKPAPPVPQPEVIQGTLF